MERLREEARADNDGEHGGSARTRVALALTGFAIFGLAVLGITSQANAAIDPSASAVLAGALKPDMQKTLKKQVPGLLVTKVTCYVPATSKLISGPCTAKFTVSKYQLKGTFKAKATLSSTSRLSWSTSSRSCTDLHGRRASCTGESSSGNGLISAQLAEAQLLHNGFSFQNASKRVKSALCTGSKAQKWAKGKFDDVYSQLNCVVQAADGSYSLVFKMAGAAGYNLTAIKKRS
jgi:hypothetical protein